MELILSKVRSFFQNKQTRQTVLVHMVLPILPTLLGVYVALWLDNAQHRSDEISKAIAVLTISHRECTQVEGVLASLKMTARPIVLPSLGISLLNILQQPDLLKSLKSTDFAEIVSSLGGIRRGLDDYQRNSVQYYQIESSPLTRFAPLMLPIKMNQPPQLTQAQANEMFRKTQEQLKNVRKIKLADALSSLSRSFEDYKRSIEGFCSVSLRAAQYLK